MAGKTYIPTFYFYNFADLVASPYTKFAAYASGLIDEKGNLTGNESSIDPLEYFVIKLKKIFEQLPPGVTKYKLGNIMGIMQLFSEEVSYFGVTKDQFNCLVEAHITNITDGKVSYLELLEDMSTGGVAGGLGKPADAPEANKGNVSGYDPVMGSLQSRSGPVNMIGAVEMFGVPSSEFQMMKKTNAYPKNATGNYLRRFGLRNADKKMAIRDEETGEIHWLPAPNKKTFVEKFNLNDLNILKESFIEPETTPSGNSAKSEVWALKAVSNFLSRHFEHVPWEGELGPGEFAVSTGGRGKLDMKLKDRDGVEIPIEVKSIKANPSYTAFNMDLSTKNNPKGVATYASTAHGLTDIYDPEYEEQIDDLLRGSPIENISRQLEARGKKFTAHGIPSIGYRSLQQRGVPILGSPQRARERVLGWRKGLLDIVGNEKRGVVLAVNPEMRHMHVLNMETGQNGSAVNRLLRDMGGLVPTGTASTPNVESGMYLPYVKMAKGSNPEERKLRKTLRDQGASPEEIARTLASAKKAGDIPQTKRMLRVDYRFSPDGSTDDPWVRNGQIAFGDLNLGNRENFRDWEKELERLSRAE